MTPTDSSEIIADEHYCEICGDLWPTKQQLAVHVWRQHGLGHDIRNHIGMGETSSQVCLLEKHTRAGLLRHFAENSDVCRLNLFLRVPPMNFEETQACDEYARTFDRSRRHDPVPDAIRLRGPILPVIGLDGNTFIGKNGWKYLA